MIQKEISVEKSGEIELKKIKSFMITLDYMSVELIFTEGTGSHTDIDNGLIKIFVGLDWEFNAVVEGILHELMEVYMFMNNFRYYNTKAPKEYEVIHTMFVLSHDSFQLSCMHVAKALTKLFPVAYDSWNDFTNKKKKENKNERVCKGILRQEVNGSRKACGSKKARKTA